MDVNVNVVENKIPVCKVNPIEAYDKDERTARVTLIRKQHYSAGPKIIASR